MEADTVKTENTVYLTVCNTAGVDHPGVTMVTVVTMAYYAYHGYYG